MRWILLAGLIALSCRPALAVNCHVNGLLPDKLCTPGSILTNVTDKDVCVHGYTEKVRNVPQSLKREVFAQYGITKDFGTFEIDHLVSLELGGSNDISNLWPEAYANPNGARVKDQVENYL